MTHCLQEMGFDSTPFEEPDLFTARSGLQAKDRLADRQDSTLHLRLDSQDDLGTSLAEVGTELQAPFCCIAIYGCLAALLKSPSSHILCVLMCSKCVKMYACPCCPSVSLT